MSVRDELKDEYPESQLMFMSEEEYDDAIIGVSERCGGQPLVAYDYDKVIEANIKMGMSYEEATEHFSTNQIGSYMGELIPQFL